MALVDYFLKLDGIEGESPDSKHKGEIAVESWSWGETQSGSHGFGGGGGAASGDTRVSAALLTSTAKSAIATRAIMDDAAAPEFPRMRTRDGKGGVFIVR